jgi:hypothetical protein
VSSDGVLRAVHLWGTPPNRVAKECAEEPVPQITKCCEHCEKNDVALGLQGRYIRVAKALTPTEQLAYLRAEHACLVEQFRTLRSEFEALLRFHILPHERAATAHRERMQAFRSLLANHRIGLEWMRYPPCGRTNVPSPLRDTRIPFSGSSQPPCAFAVAQEEETADRAVA